MIDKKFKVIIPTELSKSEDGEWKVKGLASTANIDLQGEIVDQTGLDLSPVDNKKANLNWSHLKGPENIIGTLDSYKKSKDGLWLEGRLFQNHDRAKAVYGIMSSLKKSDSGRMGMSIEGVIKERTGKDGKTIKKATIHACALTMNPVNVDTHVNLIKSLNSDENEIEFDENITKSNIENVPKEEEVNKADELMFTVNQVVSILEKTLGIGAGYTQAPNKLTGGDAQAQSNMKEKKKKDVKSTKKGKDDDLYPFRAAITPSDGTNLKVNKSLKKMDSELYKSNLVSILNDLQKLYPDNTRSDIWEAVKDRLRTSFEGSENTDN